jgi:hypothetical protein
MLCGRCSKSSLSEKGCISYRHFDDGEKALREVLNFLSNDFLRRVSMKKTSLVMVVVFLTIGAFIAMPAQVDGAGGVHVLKLQKTLPMNGNPRLFTFEAQSECIIFEIFVDNTKTGGGVESDHRWLGLAVGNSFIHPNWFPWTLAYYDELAMRALFAKEGFLRVLPVKAGQKVRFGFDTTNGSNDVMIEVTVCYVGGAASLY